MYFLRMTENENKINRLCLTQFMDGRTAPVPRPWIRSAEVPGGRGGFRGGGGGGRGASLGEWELNDYNNSV